MPSRPSAIAKSGRIAADAMNVAIGPVGASIIAFIILFSIAGAANGHCLTSPRVYFAMARDGLFFRKLGDVHPKYLTPHVSIVALGVWSSVLSLTGTFEQLYTYVIFGLWIFMGMTITAVIILRRRRPDLVRSIPGLGLPRDARPVHPGLPFHLDEHPHQPVQRIDGRAPDHPPRRPGLPLLEEENAAGKTL